MALNYDEINEAILNDRDIDESLVNKDAFFYKYLLNNKVAYYYAKNLSTRKTDIERKILAKGTEFDSRFHKTIRTLDKISEKYNLQYLLFKTYKFIDEVNDGDIDIIVKKEDFDKFLNAFETENFEVEVDEPGKAKCTKSGYSVIEPHVSISWRSIQLFDPFLLWRDPININFKNIQLQNCSYLVERTVIILKVFLSPEYLDLLSIKKLQILIDNTDTEAQLLVTDWPEATKLISSTKNYKSGKLPFFVGNLSLFLTISPFLKYTETLYILLCNTYWRLRYRIFDKLPFTHDWQI